MVERQIIFYTGGNIMENLVQERYDFVYFFDAENSNPNGDPDAGNLPRIDPETGLGIVTDVCSKRKVRNYVLITKEDKPPYRIYVKEKAVLNKLHEEAYKNVGDRADVENARQWMCKNFYDVRTFGAVMTTGEKNCGQVRGLVQFTFAKSVDPIAPLEITITRMAVTNEKDEAKERAMGRKHIVPYGLYRMEGYISAFLAKQTGFSYADLELLWEALTNMWEHDRSAARPKMAARKLFVFKHESEFGNAPAHVLFDLIKVERKVPIDEPVRSFDQYSIQVLREKLPEGVELIEKL